VVTSAQCELVTRLIKSSSLSGNNISDIIIAFSRKPSVHSQGQGQDQVFEWTDLTLPVLQASLSALPSTAATAAAAAAAAASSSDLDTKIVSAVLTMIERLALECMELSSNLKLANLVHTIVTKQSSRFIGGVCCGCRFDFLCVCVYIY
jgi:hypothetical protein